MLFVYIMIAGLITWIIWKVISSSTQKHLSVSDRTNYEKEVNEFIKHMRCESCQSNQIPVYKIKNNHNEIIDCCCEQFAKVLQDRIRDNSFVIGAVEKTITTDIKNVEFEVTASTYNSENDDSSKWEIVYRKTERWRELGFGDGDLFPGYGRLYDGDFECWYCDVGSKDRKDIQTVRQRFSLYNGPRFHKIVGDYIDFEQLYNTKGYEELYSGLDKKNRKRWYFALLKKTPTWIETKSASDNNQ